MAAPGAARASSASELVREAHDLERAHQDEKALRRYTDALTLDPTLGDAYLGLAELRARRGDLREAERVYSVALAHVPDLRAALSGRAHTRWALGQRADAEADLDEYVEKAEDAAALRELAGWYGEDGRVPAQLAAWRRAARLAARAGDPALAREARTMVLALQIVLGSADPVTAGDGSDVRRGMALAAKKGL